MIPPIARPTSAQDDHSDVDLVIDERAESSVKQERIRYPSGPYLTSASENSATSTPEKSKLKKSLPTPPPPSLVKTEEEDEEDSDTNSDNLPDLEETPTDMNDFLPQLEELDGMPKLEEISTNTKPKRKRKTAETEKPMISPVKRHRRGIRRGKFESAAAANEDDDEGDPPPEEKGVVKTKLADLIAKAKQVVSEQTQKSSRASTPISTANTTAPNEPPKQRKKKLVKRKKKKSPETSPKGENSDSSDDEVPLEVMRRRLSLNTVVEKLRNSATTSASSSSSSSAEQVEKPREISSTRMSSSAMSKASDGSSSDCLNVDFSPAAIKKRRRVLDRLADTPEFTQAKKSSSSRQRRTAAGRMRRDAAREATESISRNIQDEKNKTIKPTEPPKPNPPPPPPTPKEPPKEAKPKVAKKATKRKRTKSRDSGQLAKQLKEEELHHGWQPTGETFKRPILKPEESHYIEKSCFDSIECRLTGRKLHRRQDVVINAGEGESPYYAKIVDFFLDSENSNGTLMAWIYWYYRRNDIDAPNSTYIAGDDELIASRHHDAVSVATILTPFTMLTFNEYCRYRSFKTFTDSMYFPLLQNDNHDETEFLDYHNQVFFCRRFYENSNRSISAMPSFLRLNSKEVHKVTSNIKLRPR